jgi:hypothetical protein
MVIKWNMFYPVLYLYLFQFFLNIFISNKIFFHYVITLLSLNSIHIKCIICALLEADINAEVTWEQKNFLMKIIYLLKIKICQLNSVLNIWILFSIFDWSICWVGERKSTQEILSTEYKAAVPRVLHAKYKMLFILYCLLSVYENFFINF